MQLTISYFFSAQLRALSRSRSKRSGSALGSVFLPSSLTSGLSPEQQQQASRVQFTFYTSPALFQVLSHPHVWICHLSSLWFVSQIVDINWCSFNDPQSSILNFFIFKPAVALWKKETAVGCLHQCSYCDEMKCKLSFIFIKLISSICFVFAGFNIG